MWGEPGPIVRERGVSAATFALSAALFNIVGLALLSGFDGMIRDGLTVLLLSPLAMALPAAVGGALAGPRLARALDGLDAAIVGVVVTILSALLYTSVGAAGLLVMDVLDGHQEMVRSTSDLAEAVFVVGAYSFVAGLVASPFGALGAVVAWRQIRRAEPVEPA